MSRERLRLIEFAPSDSAILEKVGRLRVVAWATELSSAPEVGSWLDAFDGVARHWAFLDGVEPVASARMTVHAALSDVPNPEDFLGLLAEPLPAPIASINRLVVHPDYRGLGLGSSLDDLRLRAAEESGCGCVIGSTPSGDRRVAQLVSRGFRLLGSTGAANASQLLRSMPPSVALVCFFPRGAADAEPGTAADGPRL